MKRISQKPLSAPATQQSVDASVYDEQRIPFDAVIRKLANTKPPHKVSAKPAKPPKPAAK